MKLSTIWRTITGWGLGIALTTVLIPIAFVAFVLDPIRQRLVQPIVRFWGWSIMHFAFVPITVLGAENTRKVKSAVFVSNHQSMMDIFLMLGFASHNIGFLAKKQVIWIPIIGWLMLLLGHIRVDRSNPRRSLESVQRCIKAIENGWSICIFPEGTRSDDGEIKTFKSGSLKIPLRTGAPVIPVTIAGNFQIMKKKTFAVHKNPVVIHFGEPISTEDLEVKNFKSFVKDMEDRIRKKAGWIAREYPETAVSSE